MDDNPGRAGASMMQAIDATRPGGHVGSLDEAAAGYRAMDQRDAIKVLLRS